jgi:hypothetical protein
VCNHQCCILYSICSKKRVYISKYRHVFQYHFVNTDLTNRTCTNLEGIYARTEKPHYMKRIESVIIIVCIHHNSQNSLAKSHVPNTSSPSQHSIIVVYNSTTVLVGLWNPVLLAKIIFLTPTVGVKVRLFSPDSNTHSVSSMRRKAIGSRVVLQ